MCRSKAQGGRRCPACTNVERRRAYRRGIYAAKKIAAQTKRTPAPPPDDDLDYSTITNEQLEKIRQEAIDRAKAIRDKPMEKFYQHYVKPEKGEYHEYRGPDDDYSDSVIELGRALAPAIYAQYELNLRDKKITPEAIDQSQSLILKSTGYYGITDQKYRVDQTNEARKNCWTQAVISQLDEIGVERDTEKITYREKTKLKKDVKQTIETATSFFPATLIRSGIERVAKRDIVIKQSKRRAFFLKLTPETFTYSRKSYLEMEEYEIIGSTNVGISYRETPVEYEDNEENRRILPRIKSLARNPVKIKEYTRADGTQVFHIESKQPVQSFEYVQILTTDGSIRCTIHEMSHFLEQDARVATATKAFLYRRVEGKESEVYNKSRKFGVERVKDGGFVDPYIGKDYGGSSNPASEVFSMGMESVITCSNPGITKYRPVYTLEDNKVREIDGYRTDPEHQHLILGLLAGIR